MKRFIVGPSSAKIVLTTRSLGAISKLFSALAAALLIVRAISLAAFWGMYSRIDSARETGLPRTRSITGRTLVAEMRTDLVIAFACMVALYFTLPRLSAFLPPWPRKVRVGANSPSLWPTMFSVT
jgi:hypothetical protein